MVIKRSLLLSILGWILFSTVAAWAGPAAVGTLSFDVFIPPSGGTPGVNAFNISNFTGAFALPPGFPVSTAVSFNTASLMLTLQGGSTQTVPLGNLVPGPLLDSSGKPLSSLQFSSSMNFMSATFVGILSQTTFLLVDGTTFVAASPTLSFTLLPSSGSSLVAGRDLGTLDVAPVPEPGTLILMAIALAGLLVANGIRLTRGDNYTYRGS